MFDFFKNSKFVKVLMVFITASFVYFGFSGLSFNQNQYIVKIKDTRIANYDIKSYLQRNRLPQDEENIKDAYGFLIKRAYYIEGGKKIGIDVSPNQVAAMIKSEPVFLDMSGNFNREAYNNFIAQTYRSELLFEDELKKNIIYNFINFYLNNNNILSDYQLLQYLTLSATQKEMQYYEFPLHLFKDKVTYTVADLEKFYTEHRDSYKREEAIKFEYILLNPDLLLKSEKVTAAAIESYFTNNKSSKPKRMVAHIVLAFPANKEPDSRTKAAVKLQAQQILKLARQNPADFAELAQKFSQDAATAPIGGSLGLIEKNGQYFGSIEEAAFRLSPGQVSSNLIETTDGYHIIKVDAAVNWQNLAADAQSIAYILKYNKARDDLAVLQEKLGAAVFNYPHDLSRASQEVLGSNWVKSDKRWLTKQEAQLAGLPADLVNYLFDPLNIREQAGSEVFTLGNNYWVVRVTAAQKATVPTLNEIKTLVINDYVRQKSRELAVQNANDTLQKLNQGERLTLTWSAPQTFTLTAAKNYFDDDSYRRFLTAEPKNTAEPVYFLMTKSALPVLVRVNKVRLLDFKNDKEKIGAAYKEANAMQFKKEEVAFLSYLQNSIKPKTGTVKLEY